MKGGQISSGSIAEFPSWGRSELWWASTETLCNSPSYIGKLCQLHKGLFPMGHQSLVGGDIIAAVTPAHEFPLTV